MAVELRLESRIIVEVRAITMPLVKKKDVSWSMVPSLAGVTAMRYTPAVTEAWIVARVLMVIKPAPGQKRPSKFLADTIISQVLMQDPRLKQHLVPSPQSTVRRILGRILIPLIIVPPLEGPHPPPTLQPQ